MQADIGDKVIESSDDNENDKMKESFEKEVKQGIERIRKGATTVYLDRKHVNDDVMPEICNAIINSKSLEYLGLFENDIGPFGVKLLVQALKENKTIKQLFLGGNPIGDEGMGALSIIFPRPCVLETLFLGFVVASEVYGNNITDEGAIKFAEAVVGNTTLMRLRLAGNPGITSKSTPALKKMVQHSHITYLGCFRSLEMTSIPESEQAELRALTNIPIEKRTIPAAP